MRSFSSNRQSSSGTVVHIGTDWTTSNRQNSMPVQEIHGASTSWNDDGYQRAASTSRPTSRYSDRPSSSASNVSLKDTVDVFVEDKFLKSYNLQYEPIRIRIDDEATEPGSLFKSQPFSGKENSDRSAGWTSGQDWQASHVPHSNTVNRNETAHSSTNRNAGYSSKYSYREHTKSSSTTHDPASSSIVTVEAPTDRYGNSRNSVYQSTNSNMVRTSGTGSSVNSSQQNYPSSGCALTVGVGNKYTVPIGRENNVTVGRGEYTVSVQRENGSTRQSRQGNPSTSNVGQEYTIPVQRENGSHRTGPNNVTIPVSYNDYPVTGRHTGVFSPDSGRGSVELQRTSPLGGPTPLPATPIGRETSIVYSPGPDNLNNQRNSEAPKRQKSVEFSDRQSTGSSGRPTAQADEFSSSYGNDQRSVSANISVNSGGGLSYSEPNKRPTFSGNSLSRPRSDSPLEHDGVTLGDSKHFNINKSELPRHHTPPPPHNSSSLTYAVDSDDRPNSRNSDYNGDSAVGRYSRGKSVPAAPAHRVYTPAHNRSLSRGDSRPSSRVGLPTYDRDYVDKSEDDYDLDDLSDEERNVRLQQKKLQYPQSRNAALVAELKETTGSISAGRRSRKEQQFHDSMERKACSAMLDRFTAEQFIPQVPYYDEEGFAIAEYKRIFLAKQAANQARREFQSRIDAGEHVEDLAQSPEWKRLFIDSAKEEYDGTPFKPSSAIPISQKDILQINLSKASHAGYGSKLQPWQMELKRLERFN